MSKILQKEALEQLREQVQGARAGAGANPLWCGLDELDARLPELRQLSAGHTLGVTRSGWVNPYPKGDPRSLLLEYQFAIFHDDSRFKAMLQGRQTGKDFTNEGEAVTDCLANPSTRWQVAAPSERQSIDSLDQAKLWAQGYDYAIEDYDVQRESGHPQALMKSAEIIFANGSRIRAVPGKPDTVRGPSCNNLLTEFDFFEQPLATWRALLPTVINPLRGGQKKMRICTTPNGKGGAMWQIMTKPAGRKMTWSKWLVTIHHAVLMGLPVDVETIREALDDPDGFGQECECQFLDGSNVLLPYEIIALAESIEATEAIGPDFWSRTGGTVVCGIDFGRTNDPTVCWTMERVGDVWWTREVLVLRDMPTPKQEEILRSRIRRARRVCLDYTGPGIGLGDYLVEAFGQYDPKAHHFGKIELCTFTVGFKREIFPKLRRAFEAPVKLRVPISTEIREDLHDMKQIVKNGEYSYAAPRTAEGHSDRCTSLALAMRAAGEAHGVSVPPKAVERNSARARARRDRSTAL